jgi:hypothetical protein
MAATRLALPGLRQRVELRQLGVAPTNRGSCAQAAWAVAHLALSVTS